MSNKVEKMLRIPLSKLATARVTCLACNKGVVEVPVARLGAALATGGCCRFCQKEFFPPGQSAKPGPDPLFALQLALERIAEMETEGKLTVSFEVAQPE